MPSSACKKKNTAISRRRNTRGDALRMTHGTSQLTKRHDADEQLKELLAGLDDALMKSSLYFFFNDTATTEIYTLSLHDALPIDHHRWPAPPRRSRAHHRGA